MAAWKALIEDGKPTDSDLALGAMAIWLATEANATRIRFQEYPLPSLGCTLATTAAIALLNREFSRLGEKQEKAQRALVERNGVLTVDQLASITIKSNDGLFEVDSASHLDAATDAADSWLYEVADIQSYSAPPAELASVAIEHFKRFALRRSHFDLWQKALWENWQLVRRGERLAFAPAAPELEELAEVWLLREESNFMNHAWIDKSCWPDMPEERRRERHLKRSVLGVDHRRGQRRQFKIGRPSIQQIPAYAMCSAGLEGSYLAPFLERQLPKLPNLTPALLMRAWHIILDLAEVLADRRQKPSFSDVGSLRQWALTVRRKELVYILTETLGVSEPAAEEILSFFSWSRGTYKGLWGAPLIPLPSSDDLVLAHSVLATSNVIRRVEIWITKGGLDDRLRRAARGRSFEAQLRSDVRDELQKNAIVRDAACAEHQVKKTAAFPEEIDLLVRFGSLLLVGEVKCLLFPADASERFNHLSKLKSACRQARDKASAISGALGVASRALGIDESIIKTLKVVPIVVLNQGFGTSLRFHDCVITDAWFLKLYLRAGSYVSEGVFNPDGGGMSQATRTLYRSSSEAAERFERTMRQPPPLQRFRDMVRWGAFDFPTADGGRLAIAQTVVGEMSPEMRARYNLLSAQVEQSRSADTR